MCNYLVNGPYLIGIQISVLAMMLVGSALLYTSNEGALLCSYSLDGNHSEYIFFHVAGTTSATGPTTSKIAHFEAGTSKLYNPSGDFSLESTATQYSIWFFS